MSVSFHSLWVYTPKSSKKSTLCAFKRLAKVILLRPNTACSLSSWIISSRSVTNCFDSDIPSCRMLTLYFCKSSSNGEIVTSKVTVRVSAILIRPFWGFLYMYCNVTLVWFLAMFFNVYLVFELRPLLTNSSAMLVRKSSLDCSLLGEIMTTVDFKLFCSKFITSCIWVIVAEPKKWWCIKSERASELVHTGRIPFCRKTYLTLWALISLSSINFLRSSPLTKDWTAIILASLMTHNRFLINDDCPSDNI